MPEITPEPSGSPDLPPATDNETSLLANLALQGSPDDMLRLCRQIARPVLFKALRYLDDRAEAESAALQIMHRVCSSLADLARPEDFDSWLNGIILSSCRQIISRQTSRGMILSLAEEIVLNDAEDESRLPLDRGLTADERRFVLSVISRMPLRQRECVVLSYLDGLDVAQTAGLMGINEKGVTRYLTLARAHVREELLNLPSGISADAVRALTGLPVAALLAQALYEELASVTPQDEAWIEQAVWSCVGLGLPTATQADEGSATPAAAAETVQFAADSIPEVPAVPNAEVPESAAGPIPEAPASPAADEPAAPTPEAPAPETPQQDPAKTRRSLIKVPGGDRRLLLVGSLVLILIIFGIAWLSGAIPGLQSPLGPAAQKPAGSYSGYIVFAGGSTSDDVNPNQAIVFAETEDGPMIPLAWWITTAGGSQELASGDSVYAIIPNAEQLGLEGEFTIYYRMQDSQGALYLLQRNFYIQGMYDMTEEPPGS